MVDVASVVSLLVVDDESAFCTMLADYFVEQGYRVETAHNAEEARRKCDGNHFDVVLLDRRMPGEDGISLARYFREHRQTGIILVTAAGEIIDRIVGLEVGADDYVVKPFDLKELHARVKSVLRRIKIATDRQKQKSAGAKPNIAQVGRCSLDLDKQELRDENGNEVHLTGLEFDLLAALIANSNKVLHRDKLFSTVYNRLWDPADRSVDNGVARLRKKIERDPNRPKAIKTVRGVGYRFVPDPG